MKIKILTLALLIILTNIILGQPIRKSGIEIQSPVFLQNINIDASSSIGFSNITNSQISEIGSTNPATLANFSSMSSGLQFQYNTQTDYYLDLELERAKQWLPSSFGFVYPLDNLNIGLGYHQKYSSYLYFGKMPIRTVSRPDGNGDFYEASNEVIIHSPSALFSYSFSNLIYEGDRFSFGGQLYLDFWEQEDKIWTVTGNLNANDFSWKSGFIYDFNSNLSMGLHYEFGTDITGKLENNYDTTLDPDLDTSAVWRVPVNYKEPEYIFKLPDKISFGLTSNISENVLLSATLTEVFWNEINTEFQNQYEFSTNLLYSYSEIYDFTFGLFMTDREIKEQDLFNYNYPQNATYFNLGFKAKIDNLHLYAEILDNHLISVDVREHTIIKLGCNFTLNN